MAGQTRPQFTKWEELTPEEQEEIRREFDQHVQKAGANLAIGIYRHVNEDDRRMGARGRWVMTYG
jgi:hypothetical protein